MNAPIGEAGILTPMSGRVIPLAPVERASASPVASPNSAQPGGRSPRTPKPEWLRVPAPGSAGYLKLRSLMREQTLNTVCEEARCPNIGECWGHGTATFMILGDVCTRACAYCAVRHGRPDPIDAAEPERIARTVSTLGLEYVVITSVDRDDLDDGGASHFAATITATRALSPSCRIEVLIPDFQGDAAALRTVLDARPDVLNHNTETVPRLYRMARSGGQYQRTLELLARARQYAPSVPTKSGLMVGLGEDGGELVATLEDLRGVDCQILTIGQYLQPSPAHAPIARYYHPDEFRALRTTALELGFLEVQSGPLVRSSYHARDTADAYRGAAESAPPSHESTPHPSR